jgi:hypothetical protein
MKYLQLLQKSGGRKISICRGKRDFSFFFTVRADDLADLQGPPHIKRSKTAPDGKAEFQASA